MNAVRNNLRMNELAPKIFHKAESSDSSINSTPYSEQEWKIMESSLSFIQIHNSR